MIRHTVFSFLALFCAPLTLAGAWGTGPFENDDALDWVAELDGSKPDSVTRYLSRISLANGYLEVTDCAPAVAAAEVLATALGNLEVELPEEAKRASEALQRKVTNEDRRIAVAALQKCMSFENSELRQLWNEAKESESEWLKYVTRLIERISP